MNINIQHVLGILTVVCLSQNAQALFTIPTDSFDCNFNSSTVAENTAVTAYQNSSVPFGQSCVSESRLCKVGELSGSYQFATCSVGTAASCLFDGRTIAHGDSVTGYTSSTVPFGQVCSAAAETRTCNNGALSGSAQYANCETNTPRSCLFDGKTILNGETIFAYQNSSSQFGNACAQESRTCVDGTLSGSFAYGSCTIDQPASCLFDGRTIADGESVSAFLSSSAQFSSSCTQESRTCDNGSMSGSFKFGSCAVGQPASCSFDNKTVVHGESVLAFATSTVAFGQSCTSQARSCLNGALSGSYTNANCTVQAASDCTLNGKTVLHSTSVTTYASNRVAARSQCQPETRTCSNGILSGSGVYESCVADPIVIINPPKSCLLNGKTIPSDVVVKAYQSATVPFGQTCVSEQRQCLEGAMTGSFQFSSCSVDSAASCTLNRKTIAHAETVTVFTSSSVPAGQSCKTEIRTCSNGTLSGSAIAESCVVQTPPPIDPGTGGSCSQSSIIWEFPSQCRGQCGNGNGYFKSRISRDGGQKWLTLQKNDLPDDLKEIWNYMIKQNGKNSCGRPNVNYVASKNKGYVILDVKKIPDCKVCRFVEMEDERKHHGQCHKNKITKKVLKFICGEIKKKKYYWDRYGDNDSHRR
jgi:hypothetical protein